MLILNHFYRMKIEDSKSINKPNDSVSIDEEEKEKESQQQSISKEKEEKIKADFIKRLQNKFKKSDEYDSDDSNILRQEIEFDDDEKVNVEDDKAKNKQDEEEEKKEKLQRCMFRHNSKFRLRWDLLIILLALYNCITIPFEVAFGSSFVNDISIEVLDHLIDVLFFLDVLLNFRTTYINSKTGTEVIKPLYIALNYLLKGRCIIDVLASVPLELVFQLFIDNTSQLKILGLLKLVRLLRLGRIITYMKFKQDLKMGLRIFQLLFLLIILVHWIGCIWYMLVSPQDSWLPPKDQNQGYTDFYNYDNLRQYTVVFYYAILLIVGNESCPLSTGQTVFSSGVVIMGAIATAFIFGNMAALMAVINKKDSTFQEQMDFVSNTMRSIKLPEKIQNQIIDYLMHCQESPDIQQGIDKFFEILSPSLKNVIMSHIYQKIIKNMKIFDDSSEIEVAYVINNLKTMLFIADDEIIRQGDFGNRMYFIASGEVDIYLSVEISKKELKEEQELQENQKEEQENHKEEQENHKEADSDSNSNSDSNSFEEDSDEDDFIVHQTKIGKLKKGNYFGEIALITNLKRTTTIKSVEYSTIAFLTRESFESIKKEFPQVYINFKENIKNYNDRDFEFRRNMVRNTPYFKHLDQEIIDEIVYLLRPNRFDPNTIIIKHGDITDKIHYLKQGEIEVTIPVKTGIHQSEAHFEVLNAGSCFCAFSAFSEEVQQLVNFKAKTSCVVETIEVKDLIYIERTYLQLSDEIKKLRLSIDNKDKSELDFFRYLKPLRKALKDSVRRQIRLKFKAAVKKFIKKYALDKECLPNALVALQEIMKDRRRKQREILHLQRINTIKYLQEKSPLMYPLQADNMTSLNMFINNTVQGNYDKSFNQQSFNLQNNYNNDTKGREYTASNKREFDPEKEKEELETLRKLTDEARSEKFKTNQNLAKLLLLIESHNTTLDQIESKFKREFAEIKANIRKFKVHQQQQEKLKAEQYAYEVEERKRQQSEAENKVAKQKLESNKLYNSKEVSEDDKEDGHQDERESDHQDEREDDHQDDRESDHQDDDRIAQFSPIFQINTKRDDSLSQDNDLTKAKNSLHIHESFCDSKPEQFGSKKSQDYKQQDLSSNFKRVTPENLEYIEKKSPVFMMDQNEEEPVRLFKEPAFSCAPIQPNFEEVMPQVEEPIKEVPPSKHSSKKIPKESKQSSRKTPIEKKSKNEVEKVSKSSKKTLGELPFFEERKDSNMKIAALNNFNQYDELERFNSNTGLVNNIQDPAEIELVQIDRLNEVHVPESSTHSVSNEESEKERNLEHQQPAIHHKSINDELSDEEKLTNEKQDDEQSNEEHPQHEENNGEGNSENSSEDISNEDQNYSDDNAGNFDENMPRLIQDVNDEEDLKSKKKKMKKIKFKKLQSQKMKIEEDGKRNKKKEKSQSKKGTQVKKSYHAYLEHPRLRHQQPGHSQKDAKDIFDPLNMNSRPGKK